jgi:uncharacterized alkaline shock family protein YloU
VSEGCGFTTVSAFSHLITSFLAIIPKELCVLITLFEGTAFYHRNSLGSSRDDTIIKKEANMGEDTTSLGGIHISPGAIATIAYHATLESYGVVGLAPKNLADGIVKTITRDPSRGVTVSYNGEDIDIEIHVIVEYGTRINSVAESVANTVRFHVEKALGLRVNKIDVHVAGLRISNID